MKVILTILAIVIAMVLLGWMTFDRTDHSASMTIDTEEVQKDTAKAVEKGKELVDEAIDKGKKLIDGTENATEDSSDSDTTTDSQNPLTGEAP